MTVAQQYRIFAPLTMDGSWAEVILARVVRPLTEEFALDWFWFTQYTHPGDLSDCKPALIPPGFGVETGQHRSVRFRFAVAENEADAMRQRAADLIAQLGAACSGVEAYDYIAEFGAPRFSGPKTGDARLERIELVVALLHAAARMTLHALEPPGAGPGPFHWEVNPDLAQNPHGSTFQSIVHLLCNMTQVPMVVGLRSAMPAQAAARVELRTAWMPWTECEVAAPPAPPFMVAVPF